MPRFRTLVPVLAAALLASACAANPTAPNAPAGPTGSSAPGTASAGAPLAKDPALYAELPASVKAAGHLVSVSSGSFPPYEIVGSTGSSVTGASADMFTAIGQLIGVPVTHVNTGGLPSELAGIQAGRYDFAEGPVGDFTTREGTETFVDWVREHVVFAVPKGNPDHVNSLADICGLRIAVEAGGSAETVVRTQSATCVKLGKKAVDVESYQDQPTAVLAVRSGRADAYFSSEAPLTYFVQQSGGQLQVAGTGSANGFAALFQGAVVPKNSPLAKVLLQAVQKLIADGTYAKIMAKYGLDRNELATPGINLAAGE
jgi:polar amino acid transport system substrate-binding protein